MVAEDEEMQESLRNEAEAREFPNVHQHPEPMSGLSEIPHPAPAAKKSLLPAAQIRSTSRGNRCVESVSTLGC